MNPTVYFAVMAAGLLLTALVHSIMLGRMNRKRCVAWITLPIGIVLGFVLAKAVYLLVRVDAFSGRGLSAVASMNPEEFSFAGGCIGFVFACILASGISGEDWRISLDAYAVPACLMVAVARASEVFLGNVGIGDYLENPDLCFFPIAILNQEYQEWYLAVCMLEAFAALFCMILSLVMDRNDSLIPGLHFERAVYRLCAFQIFFELIRAVSIVFSFIHTEQVICILCITLFIARGCISIHRDPDGRKSRKDFMQLIMLAVIIGVNIFLQFALDKPYLYIDPLPISEGIRFFLEDHSAAICYSLIGITIVMLLVMERVNASRRIRQKN